MKRLIILLVLIAAAMASVEENRGLEEEEDLFEGDMKLTEDQMDELNSRAALRTRKWPGATVPYELDVSISSQPRAMAAVNAAFAEYAQKTCVRFRPKTSSDTAYLSIFKGSGCWSYVGRTGKKQQLSLAGGCWGKGTVVHELAHALGFFHEQSRPDRDTFVTIKFENIQTGKESNFRKHSTSQVTTHNTPYDFGSVMHYSGRAFSKNRLPTIVPKKAGVTLGQRRGLSPIDESQVNTHYSCKVSPPTQAPPTQAPPTQGPPSGAFSCNFDKDTCGFVNLKSDKFDWMRRKGTTPSGGTGPSGDHTTGKGYYMYIETSSPRNPKDNAKLEKGGLTFDSNTCVSFYYQMLGRDVGTLNVFVGSKLIFTKSGTQGSAWKKADKIRVQSNGANLKLVFEGIRGKSWQGDIAIDDVRVESCGGTPPPPPATPPPATPPPVTAPPATPPPGGRRCGYTPITQSRVIGGNDVKPGAWPWQIALKRGGRFICGGSLVSDRWVVTAAHCVTSTSASYQVVTGDHNRNTNEGTEQTINVKRVISHPNYNRPRLSNDIALLELTGPAKLSDRVNPVCLPPHNYDLPAGSKCYITGWGKIKHPGSSHPILQQAMIPSLDQAKCKVKAQQSGFGIGITDEMLCAGVDNSILSGCHGDSGGPYVCVMPDGRYTLQGDVSWGSGSCNTRQMFTVFGRVARFRNWIDQHMGNGGKPSPPPPNTPPPNTPPPHTPPPPNTPPPPSSSFSCNFDKDTCGFINLKSDKFDWTRKSGTTPSSNTGPTSSKGYYMYIETSSPRVLNDNAKLEKGGLSFDGNTCIRFNYNMYGASMGKLIVRVGSKSVFSISGNQGNQWKKADIRVQDVGVYPLVFEGIRGSSWQGDIAIDDVRVESCGGIPPTSGPQTPPPQTPAPPAGGCGVRPHTRIVGGTAASKGSWPWQVQLRTTSGFPYCGGSLIHPQWILTATHCVSGKSASSIVIRAGAHFRTSNVGTEQDIKVSKVITHASYHKPTSYAHDIALLKLATPAKLNRAVNLVCLPENVPAPTDGTKCWITGWGRLSSGGATPNILQQVAVPIASRARCDIAYPGKIHDSMLCAGQDQGGIDTCQGDSGGPLVCETGGRYYIHGATSWGYGCASPGKFGVYAHVKNHMSWVKSEMAKN